MNIKEFAVHKFDVLVLLLINTTILAVLIYFTRHGEGSELVIWAMRSSDMVQGALLMALKGSREGNRATDKNGNSDVKR